MYGGLCFRFDRIRSINMIKVITYGTYDLLHYGHIRLLQRAKELGDYLIVGVTADSYDLTRGKINVQQSLIERIEAVRATGFADEIIVEEYEGQKIDDIKRLDVDIFAIGSDWNGHFDYLNEFCKVVYLERTEGISSSGIRSEKRIIRLGLLGDSSILAKVENESRFVNGIQISGICSKRIDKLPHSLAHLPCVTSDYQRLLEISDAIYIISHPSQHDKHIKMALECGRHVLCESPITIDVQQFMKMQQLASEKHCVLMDAIKTAYSTAYNRLLVLVKSGVIGDVYSVDATCTSLKDIPRNLDKLKTEWNSLCAWGPTAVLPIFQILGTEYVSKQIQTKLVDDNSDFDLFTKVSFVYPHAVASMKVGQGVKSEGELIISGTRGYIYVPAPWWKTDYFEVRYENPAINKRYFYQLDGEGIRYELVSFVKSIENLSNRSYIEEEVSKTISSLMDDFYKRNYVLLL